MRAGARSMALAALGLWTFSCAVYRADEIPLLPGEDPPLSGAGGTGTTGGGVSTAGAASSAGKPAGGAPSAGSGGVNPVPEEQGGESAGGAEHGGESHGGAAGGGGGGPAGGAGAAAGGSSGAGGNAGSGGSGVSGSGGVGGAAGTGGNGGSGGGVTAPGCSDHPLTASATWTATASHDNAGQSPPANVLDGKTTRWTSGKAQSGDEWLQIDFGQKVTISHVNLQQGNVDTNDYPRSYAVIVSDATKDMNAAPRATGMGKTGVSTAIALPKLFSGRYLLVKQLGSSLSWWSTQEVEVSCSD